MRARSPFQDSNTARMAISSWVMGSSGKATPASVAAISLNRAMRPVRSSAPSSVSEVTPLVFFTRSISCSKRSPATPITILPNIWTKRR